MKSSGFDVVLDSTLRNTPLDVLFLIVQTLYRLLLFTTAIGCFFRCSPSWTARQTMSQPRRARWRHRWLHRCCSQPLPSLQSWRAPMVSLPQSSRSSPFVALMLQAGTQKQQNLDMTKLVETCDTFTVLGHLVISTVSGYLETLEATLGSWNY